MSLSAKEIVSILQYYEQNYHTGMDISLIFGMIHAYTSGYSYLVSFLFKIMDEQLLDKDFFLDQSLIWIANEVKEAVKQLLKKTSTLFEDIKKKLVDYPELRAMLHAIFFNGQIFPYNMYNKVIDIGRMFGFIKEKSDQVCVSNRIFET